MKMAAAQTLVSREPFATAYGRPAIVAPLADPHSSRRKQPASNAAEATACLPYIVLLPLLLLVGCCLMASCRPAGAANAERYDLKGKVVSFDKSRHEVTIAHDAIRGFMPAMTMPFTVKDEWVYKDLAEGDGIQAALVVTRSKSWLEDIVVTRIEGKAESDKARLHLPEPGESAPNLALINQDGKRIHTGDYSGRALLITFIYTRCPMPDQCPLITANFAEIDRVLAADPSFASKTHLISVTIDPEYDSPKVLRAYGSKYVGAFDRWEFATGTADEIKTAADWFGLSYWPENGQIIHALNTALIGPDGRLARLYRGNEWKPDDVASDIKTLVSQ